MTTTSSPKPLACLTKTASALRCKASSTISTHHQSTLLTVNFSTWRCISFMALFQIPNSQPDSPMACLVSSSKLFLTISNSMHGLSDYHDKFLKAMLVESLHGKQGQPKKTLNLTKFIKEVRNNRRWTYTGSLTTAPFSEGILWNICEHVIPLRQTTLDMFLDYRKIEQETVFNKFENEQQEKEVEAKLSIQPEQMKPYCSDHGDCFFRVAACNRVVQDQGNRPVYHIDCDH